MTPEHLAWRRGDGTPDAPTLPATDCAAILCFAMGWPSYRSPADIYKARWHGVAEETESDRLSDERAIMEVGNQLEDYILRRWHHRHRVTLGAGPRLQLAAYPWWRGSLDAAPVVVDGLTTIVDAKTMRHMSAGHWYTGAGAPCWPGAYLAQVAQYAVVSTALGAPVEAIALAVLDTGDCTLSERRALLTDPIAQHIDPEHALPTHEDEARPFTVSDLGLAAFALGGAFRTEHLLGDTPPCPPPDGPVAAWWAAKPRPRPSSRPATDAEAAAIADYLAALAAEKEADAAKVSARAEIARSMSATDPVARIYCDIGSASIGEKGSLSIRGAK